MNQKLAANRLVEENHGRFLERRNLFAKYGYDTEKERNRLVELVEPIQGKILEVGTGKGYLALVLANKGYRFTTVDVSREEQEIAELNLQYYRLDHQVCFTIGDAENLGFEEGSFNVIFSANTLHHLKNPERVVDELVRVLTPSGKLVLSDFNEEGFALVDKIHAMEGRVHEMGRMRISDAEKYLRNKDFELSRRSLAFEDVLIATKQP